VTGLPDTNVYWEGQGTSRVAGPFIELSIPSVYQPAHDWRRKAPYPLLGQGPAASIAITAVDPSTGKITAPAHKLVSADGPLGVVSAGGSVPSGLDTDDDYWAIVLDANTVQLATSFINSGCNYPGRTITPIDSFGDAGSGSLSIVLRDDAVRAGKEVLRTSEGMREVTVQVEAFGALDQANASSDAVLTPKQLVTDVLASAPLFVEQLDEAGAGISTIGIADIQDGVRVMNVKVGSVNEQRAQTQISLYVNSSFSNVGPRVDSLQITPTVTTPGGDTIAMPQINIDLETGITTTGTTDDMHFEYVCVGDEPNPFTLTLPEQRADTNYMAKASLLSSSAGWYSVNAPPSGYTLNSIQIVVGIEQVQAGDIIGIDITELT